MSAKKPKYRITPSLLSKWSDLLNADRDWESFFGDADEPSVSPEDFYAKREQELLDAINRVPFVSEAASKGTALNEIVDCILDRRKQREDMKVERVYSDCEALSKEVVALKAELDGFTFVFDMGLVKKLSDYFFGAICQHRCEAVMGTDFGPVILYGDADYILRDVVHDLKSTSRYDRYGKFAEGMQKDLYPWCLIESGEMDFVSGFEYTIVPLTGGTATNPVISGEIKKEYYPYNHNASTGRLRASVEPFIEWIEGHRELITHKRIFNEE